MIDNKEMNTKNTDGKEDADKQKKKFVCKVCGYVYEDFEMPSDFICPLCSSSPADFEEVK